MADHDMDAGDAAPNSQAALVNPYDYLVDMPPAEREAWLQQRRDQTGFSEDDLDDAALFPASLPSAAHPSRPLAALYADILPLLDSASQPVTDGVRMVLRLLKSHQQHARFHAPIESASLRYLRLLRAVARHESKTRTHTKAGTLASFILNSVDIIASRLLTYVSRYKHSYAQTWPDHGTNLPVDISIAVTDFRCMCTSAQLDLADQWGALLEQETRVLRLSSVANCFASFWYHILEPTFAAPEGSSGTITSDDVGDLAYLFSFLRGIDADNMDYQLRCDTTPKRTQESDSSASSDAAAAEHQPFDATGAFSRVGEAQLALNEVNFTSRLRVQEWARQACRWMGQFEDDMSRIPEFLDSDTALFAVHHMLIACCKSGFWRGARYLAELLAGAVHAQFKSQPSSLMRRRLSSALSVLAFMLQKQGLRSSALQVARQAIDIFKPAYEAAPAQCRVSFGMLYLQHARSTKELCVDPIVKSDRPGEAGIDTGTLNEGHESAQEAIRLLRDAVQRDASCWMARFHLGVALFIKLELHGFILDREDSDTTSSDSERLDLDDMMERQRLAGEALGHLDAAAEAKPWLFEPYLADFLLKQAQSTRGERGTDIAYCALAIKIAERWLAGWEMDMVSLMIRLHDALGAANMQQGHYIEAKAAYTTAIEISGGKGNYISDTLRGRAWANLWLGYWQAAENDAEAAIKSDIFPPDDDEVRLREAELTAVAGFSRWMLEGSSSAKDSKFEPALRLDEAFERYEELSYASPSKPDGLIPLDDELESHWGYYCALIWHGGIQGAEAWSRDTGLEVGKFVVDFLRRIGKDEAPNADNPIHANLARALLFYAATKAAAASYSSLDAEAAQGENDNEVLDLLIECTGLIETIEQSGGFQLDAPTRKTAWMALATVYSERRQFEFADQALEQAAKITSCPSFLSRIWQPKR
ncbi:hypothetical protein OC834_003741 [Tilletia horrida]|nr:hypothetical protein OC834_003741 [Tilletia horrida]